MNLKIANARQGIIDMFLKRGARPGTSLDEGLLYSMANELDGNDMNEAISILIDELIIDEVEAGGTYAIALTSYGHSVINK